MKHAQEETTLDRSMADNGENNHKNNGMRKWLARFGIAGFMFFFIKGLVWLAVIFGVGQCVL